MEESKPTKLECPRCKKVWDYKGDLINQIGKVKYPLYVTCPRCRKNVPIPFTKEKEQEDKQ